MIHKKTTEPWMLTEDRSEERKVSMVDWFIGALESLKADFIYENVGGQTKNQSMGQLNM